LFFNISFFLIPLGRFVIAGSSSAETFETVSETPLKIARSTFRLQKNLGKFFLWFVRMPLYRIFISCLWTYTKYHGAK